CPGHPGHGYGRQVLRLVFVGEGAGEGREGQEGKVPGCLSGTAALLHALGLIGLQDGVQRGEGLGEARRLAHCFEDGSELQRNGRVCARPNVAGDRQGEHPLALRLKGSVQLAASDSGRGGLRGTGLRAVVSGGHGRQTRHHVVE
ncbi:hypothetical protein ACHAWF_000161, partial [Thalassiosira exigua]